MSHDKLTELERRLAMAERDVEETREQVRALLEAARSRKHRARRLALVSFILAFVVMGALVTKAQGGRPEVLTVRAPFQVVGGGGKVLLSVEQTPEGLAKLVVGDAKSGLAALGVGQSGDGYVIIRNATGKDAVALGRDRGIGMGLRLYAADGVTVKGSLALGLGNEPIFSVGDSASGGVDAGVGKSGAGFVTVRRATSKVAFDLSQLGGRPMALRILGENGKDLVRLTTDATGGYVHVLNAAGVPVGGLLSSASGGGLALTGPDGGKSAISLSVEPSGGKVKVFPQNGGSAQAELSAAPDGGGAINVYNKAGEAVGWLQATSGGNALLEIGRNGKIYVRAGVLENGRGIVMAGPDAGGAPPGMVIPYYLEGRIKK
jgi:hypothetical protein